ncbi:hypothetical protein Pcinc_001664 [Petrolisthes cinctipes]|uniref:Uncharacterized protein n=1 Tax=Petrolisthes cinctipes TaxID=88211 RepID=A0AAE1G0K0_PETCI|nr:hypothetical protein Pcinc_011821 [Petrolisthes cinctipes]KAK3889100.1 hypothetical protein Pcinc_006843 [Petrolisthes cinctipes]KAK3894572.1 hypothetical protein Pcinc_001664 [Petrolisthes cinctipes]
MQDHATSMYGNPPTTRSTTHATNDTSTAKQKCNHALTPPLHACTTNDVTPLKPSRHHALPHQAPAPVFQRPTHANNATITLTPPRALSAHGYTGLAMLLRCLQQYHASQAALPQLASPAHAQAHLAALHAHHQRYPAQQALRSSRLLATHCYVHIATLYTQLQ